MAEYRTICCAIDLSEGSRIALQEACDLARRLGASLTLLHVFRPPAAAGEMLVPASALLEGARQDIERKLAGWAAEAERLAGKPVATALLAGDPGPTIVDFLREKRCDLVVAATHGHTGLKHLVLGSVAEYVVRQAPCAVLVARR